MNDSLEQYYFWRVVSITVFGCVFLLWQFTPLNKKIGVVGFVIMLLISFAAVSFMQYKAGYNPKSRYDAYRLSSNTIV